MPRPEKSHRRQDALYWAYTGDDDNGDPLRDEEFTELKVRWEWGRKETVDAKGVVIAVDATVVVDREVPIYSFFWKGSVEDLAELLPGTGRIDRTDVPTDDIMQVMTYKEVPDVKGRIARREVGLQRYSSRMPEAG